MAILPILEYPHADLKTKAKPVEEIDADILRLVDDMAETMYAAPGIGLAANQVGILKRVVVIDIDYVEEKSDLIVMINPEIIARDGEVCWEEGCLSFPGVHEEIKRSAQVTMRALNRDGLPFEVNADGLLAVAIQHELDHLDGVTMIDRVSFLKKKMMLRQLGKSKPA